MKKEVIELPINKIYSMCYYRDGNGKILISIEMIIGAKEYKENYSTEDIIKFDHVKGIIKFTQ